jgi:hypothetical protein
MASQYFYDGQIERFVVQFIRIMSGYEVEFGADRAGSKTLQRVPIYYADGSRQVATILAGNSENTMNAVPAMATYISGLTYDRDRMQNPTFVNKMNIRQRKYDAETDTYEQTQGNAFTIERAMPVPYTLELKLDIWTSNTKQKLQLIEQILPLFNPGLEIQSTDNYIDWTSLSVVYLDSPTWSSRTVSATTENPIDIATFTFKMPIWISPPAKVKKLGVIQKIIANIHDAQGDLNSAAYTEANLMGTRMYYTPMDYGVLLIGNTLTLLKVQDIETLREPTLTTPTKIGTRDVWRNLVNVYGTLVDGISQIRLMSDDGVTETVGTVTYHPTDDSMLIFNADVDTYPSNSLDPIDAIIDPRKNTAIALADSAVAGTRYLILAAIGSTDTAYGDGAINWRGGDGVDLIASANDIIEYNGTHWTVVFDSSAATVLQYVSNLNTGTQYKWNLNQWVKSFEGEYKNGLWTLVL